MALVIFGAILLISGIWVLFNPTKTVAAVAQSLGFIFALVGIFWIIEAFMTKDANQLWVLGLISGIIMVGLGFWAGGQIFPVQVYTLLIFAGSGRYSTASPTSSRRLRFAAWAR